MFPNETFLFAEQRYIKERQPTAGKSKLKLVYSPLSFTDTRYFCSYLLLPNDKNT